ncbi:hypothetical protein CgunFtcFv8_025080 [Champsocephalus gunnari]|uniref:Uncharacterized protein n=1 Tax=Champsocephalus gunnari TaxID=52237 RepID=A0AAN8DGG0_CHAGU|nr:hypothetical protein CgunFtcFv8_025080 [Champsocephalus gunnari]
MGSVVPQRDSAFIPFHSHPVLLSTSQSQRAASPRALSGWNSLEKAGHVFGAGTARIHTEPNVKHSLGRCEVNQQGKNNELRSCRYTGGRMIVCVRGCTKDGVVGRL